MRLWEKAIDELIATIKIQDVKIAELTDACQLALDTLNNMTTTDFSLGKDKHVRDKLESVLNSVLPNT